MSSPARLPLTYDECRARFQRAATDADVTVAAHPISARGPYGQGLTIDSVRLGPPTAPTVLIILSGVHGVEGFFGSALQAELLDRWRSVPDGVGIAVVHAVNPWGMAWWRRQNESNVDLNRNWRRDRGVPFDNAAYDELHPIACPDVESLPAVDEMLSAAQTLVSERGLAWVRDAITVGQYRHRDGLHFGGDRTEESNRVLETVVPELVGDAKRVLTVDLHSGHGPPGAVTALSDKPPGSAQEQFLRSWCHRVEATADNPEATTALKMGQIANGFAELLPGAECFATSLEFGTVDDVTQLAATYQEQWVYRRGDRQDPQHAAAVWAYRCCFTPTDADWEATVLRDGRNHLDCALDAVASWT